MNLIDYKSIRLIGDGIPVRITEKQIFALKTSTNMFRLSVENMNQLHFDYLEEYQDITTQPNNEENQDER